jgi:hypothetical protein
VVVVNPLAPAWRKTRLSGLWVFIACLLLAQTLGLFHGVVHGPGHGLTHSPGHDTAHDHAHDEAHDDAPALAHQTLFDQLFSGHASDDLDPQCRLFDQSSHLDSLPALPVMGLPLAISPFVFSLQTGLAVARWHALFEARGPPSVC